MDEDTRQQIVDDEQLRILRMGYFVAAGMTAFVALIGLMYAFVGFFILSRLSHDSGQNGPPAFIGPLIGTIGLVLTIVVVSIAALQFFTGQNLKARKSRTFCLVVAGITCLSIPVGTFLGVCTFVVLGRPSVQKLFEG